MDLTQLANLGEFIGGVAVLMWVVVAFFHGVDAMYLRYLEGVISPEAWSPQERIVTGLLRSPFTRRWWATGQSQAFSDRFRAFVDEKLSGSLEGPHWQVATASELEGR